MVACSVHGFIADAPKSPLALLERIGTPRVNDLPFPRRLPEKALILSRVSSPRFSKHSQCDGAFTGKLEKDSMTLVDRLADPAMSGISAIKTRLTKLESEQQNLKSKITDLTLQIRDRRDLDISTEEVEAADKDFSGLWEELEFDERQYALRLLLKEITLTFKKKEKEGEIKIEAWGRNPKPLQICLEKRKSKKLRNQDVRHPWQESNLRHQL